MPPPPDHEHYQGGGENPTLASVVLQTKAYKNPYDSHKAMEDVQGVLAGAGLAHVEAFNAIYLELTGCILYALDHRDDPINKDLKFDDEAAVRRTIGIFADQYLRQLRFHARGRSDLVDAPWQWLFYSDEAKRAPKGMQFLMGMGSHILYDLPWALAISEVDESYHEDYTKTIGILIARTAGKLASDYIPGPAFLRRPSKSAVLTMVALWREMAWRYGEKLQKAGKLPVAEYGEKVRRIKEEVTYLSELNAQAALKLGRHALGGVTQSDEGLAA